MLKNFRNHYNKITRPKTFFARGVKVRCSAYGDEVASEFADWMKYSLERWDRGDFLICEQGSVSGTDVVRGSFYGRVKQGVPLTAVGDDSALRPLILGNMLLEIDKSGYVSVNGRRRFDVGLEIKGWATLSLPDPKEDILFVIARRSGSRDSTLTGYRIAAGDISASPCVSAVVRSVLDEHSDIVCFGRHIFVCHDSSLLYYYYSGKDLRYVPVGDYDDNRGKEYCNSIGRFFAADGERIYWSAGESVYAIKVGHPDKVIKLMTERGGKALGLTAYGGDLYVPVSTGGRVTCYRYSLRDGAKKMLFADDTRQVIPLATREKSARYVRLSGDGRKVTDRTLTGRDAVTNGEMTVSGGKIFCAGNELYENVSYVGTYNGRTVCVRRRERNYDR